MKTRIDKQLFKAKWTSDFNNLRKAQQRKILAC